ncbi:hypothetical protein HMPREF3205_00047, partial [Streptococcus pasteurianus]
MCIFCIVSIPSKWIGILAQAEEFLLSVFFYFKLKNRGWAKTSFKIK